MHCKGCDWKGNITDVEEHLNGNCTYNVAAISKKRKDAEEKAKQLEAKVQALQEELDVQRAKTAALALRSIINVVFEAKYSFHNPDSVLNLSNRVSLCSNTLQLSGNSYSPIGGWKAVYNEVKRVHADWVKNYSNEKNDFQWNYGLLLSTCYVSDTGFQSNQRDNIKKWLHNYWSWTQDNYIERK